MSGLVKSGSLKEYIQIDLNKECIEYLLTKNIVPLKEFKNKIVFQINLYKSPSYKSLDFKKCLRIFMTFKSTTTCLKNQMNLNPLTMNVSSFKSILFN